MNSLTHLQLRETADQFSVLAGTLQMKPFELKAKQIRFADRALTSMDSFFSHKLVKEAKQWRESKKALHILEHKCKLLENKTREIESLERRIEEFKTNTKAWFDLSDDERDKIIINSNRAQDFLLNQEQSAEQYVLHRYKRFLALEPLTPYADNAHYLCESLFHFENRNKYEAHIEKLEDKVSKAQDRLKTVSRGFWIAIVFCLFIFTIPICFPFSLSLWKRKRNIESQIVNVKESIRREQKRLIAADEGAVLSVEIRDILGNISLEVVRDILLEVRELRVEFLGPDRTSSSAVLLLHFLAQNREKLTEIFGVMPEEPMEMFFWLTENVNKYQNTQTHIHQLQSQKELLDQQVKQLTKGYSKTLLDASLYNLKNITATIFLLPFDDEEKEIFCDICLQVPSVISKVREVLYYLSRQQTIHISYWNALALQVQAHSNMFSLCVLHGQYASEKNSLGYQSSKKNNELNSILI